MSRIQEALTKAAREKARLVVPDLPDIVTEVARPVTLAATERNGNGAPAAVIVAEPIVPPPVASVAAPAVIAVTPVSPTVVPEPPAKVAVVVAPPPTAAPAAVMAYPLPIAAPPVAASPAPIPVAAPLAAPELSFEEFAKKCTRHDWKFDPRINVFAAGSSLKVGAERFRTLRSRLYQISETRKLKRVLVTSSIASEGKSFVCANLAQSIVHSQNRRVLLIDADLRRPSLHTILNAPRNPGLTNYLRGDVDERAIIQKGPLGDLFFIPAGDEVGTPSELLLNERMKKLLDLASNLFDWIILDSPPSLPVHDANLLANFCDGVLFVVKAASTDVDMAVKASEGFQQKNLLGVVFNHTEDTKSYGNTYYR